MFKNPAILAEIGEIDGFLAIFCSSKMKWKSNFSKSLNSSNLSWFNWIVFWILHSKRLQKTCILQNCKKNQELHTLNMLCGICQPGFGHEMCCNVEVLLNNNIHSILILDDDDVSTSSVWVKEGQLAAAGGSS